MPVTQNKLKTLRLMSILLEQTDENHTMNATELIEALAKYDITAERKSIYNEIESLKEYGLDIIQNKGTNPGYYVGSHDFELTELKLLVDAVSASKFITEKKSRSLIAKLEKQTSKYNASQLQRQIFILNRPKTENENIYYSVDTIQEAITANKQITFKYVRWNLEKTCEERHEGKIYKVSPWALTWDDENYYLVSYDEELGDIRHFRVDKMRSAEVAKESRLGAEIFKNFDLAAYAKKTFGMFGGEDKHVILECDNSMIDVIIDRFGQDVRIIPDMISGRFTTAVNISVSPQFFGWLAGLGDKVKLAAPAEVVTAYKEHLQAILKQYEV